MPSIALTKRKPILSGVVYNAPRKTKSSGAGGSNSSKPSKINTPKANNGTTKKNLAKQIDLEPTINDLDELNEEAQEALVQYTYDGQNIDLLGIHLREIARFPLLTPEQALEYGRKIRANIGARNLLDELKANGALQSEQKFVTLEEQEARKELQRAVNEFYEYRTKLVNANLRLVVSIAKKYRKSGVELIDLLQMGAEGLIKAAEKFDPSKGYRFSTYAYWWIRQTITRGIAQEGRTIRLPIHVNQKIYQINRASRKLYQELGRKPTSAEIAERLEMDDKQVRELLRNNRVPLSLDQPVGASDNGEELSSLGSFVESPYAKPMELAEKSQILEELIKVMSSNLTPQERDVLKMRFGIGCSPMTLEQVGEFFNISREKVRQIQNKALRKLRNNPSVKQLSSALFKP